MAVTGRRSKTFWAVAALICALSQPLRADDSAAVHAAIGAVADALSSGDPELAMSWFDKRCADYDKLTDDFTSLAGAYYVENEIDFKDEDIQSSSATITVDWRMTLNTRQTGFTKNRKADITFKLLREGKQWRITSLSTIGIFDPQAN